MKKNLKKIIRIIIKFFVIFLGKINTGRFFLEELNRSILSYKKVIVYKDLKLKFYAPNRLSYYRIETFSTKEPETLNWIEKFEKKTTFWDVGANIGLYSCYAAKSRECKVYAFEPSIFNLEWLGKNVFLNKLVEKIVVISNPLTEIISQNTLNFSSAEWGGALTTFGQSYGHDGKDLKKVFQFSTLGISMNDAKNLLKIPQPEYIKIDVDGIEYLILKGGEKVLLNTKELLIEVNEKFTQQKNNCEQYLKKLGFSLKEKKRSYLFKNTDYSSSYNQIWVRQI
jgi:FkbM family methyltransferase|tara:strand:+ start:72 stop:917 length:846 start_codon:yes stop_codon:yes gene_type:complete